MDPFYPQAHQQLLADGYHPIPADPGGMVHAYYKIENPVVYAILLCSGKAYAANQAAIHTIAKQLEEHLQKQLNSLYCSRIFRLLLLYDLSTDTHLVESVESAVFLPADPVHQLIWYYTMDTDCIHVPQGAPNRLAGLEKICHTSAPEQTPAIRPLPPSTHAKPMVTIGLLILIWLIFIGVSLSGQEGMIWQTFGLSRENLFVQHRLWCIFTYGLLHGGLEHILCNSLYLYVFGSRAERYFGHKKYILLFVTGCFTSALSSLLFHPAGVSIGISGVVFTLIGTLLCLSRKGGASYSGMNFHTFLLLALSSLTMGFLIPQTDNWGHIGGFFGGIFFCWLVLHRQNVHKHSVEK